MAKLVTSQRDLTVITVKVTNDIAKRIDLYAMNHRMYRSEVVRMAILEFLTKEGFLHE